MRMLQFAHEKQEVCNKTRSAPATVLFKGQGTEDTTVKWSIRLLLNVKWVWRGLTQVKLKKSFFLCKSTTLTANFKDNFSFVSSLITSLFSNRIPTLERKSQENESYSFHTQCSSPLSGQFTLHICFFLLCISQRPYWSVLLSPILWSRKLLLTLDTKKTNYLIIAGRYRLNHINHHFEVNVNRQSV